MSLCGCCFTPNESEEDAEYLLANEAGSPIDARGSQIGASDQNVEIVITTADAGSTLESTTTCGETNLDDNLVVVETVDGSCGMLFNQKNEEPENRLLDRTETLMTVEDGKFLTDSAAVIDEHLESPKTVDRQSNWFADSINRDDIVEVLVLKLTRLLCSLVVRAQLEWQRAGCMWCNT